MDHDPDGKLAAAEAADKAHKEQRAKDRAKVRESKDLAQAIEAKRDELLAEAAEAPAEAGEVSAAPPAEHELEALADIVAEPYEPESLADVAGDEHEEHPHAAEE